MMKSDIKAAILAFVGLLLALIIGAACGLLLLAFHNQTKVLRFCLHGCSHSCSSVEGEREHERNSVCFRCW